jgi:hypothetical protein
MSPRQKPWLNRDLAAQAQRAGAGTDLLDIEQPHLARLVQVDVEPDAMVRGDREDAVELALRIAIDLQGVDAADEIGALAHRRIEQVEDAGAGA